MMWFAPRPYLKWAGAAAIVGVSWLKQVMPSPVALHPFARVDIPAGGDGLSPTAEPIPGVGIRPMAEGREPGERALIALPGEQLARVSAASAYRALRVAVATGR